MRCHAHVGLPRAAHQTKMASSKTAKDVALVNVAPAMSEEESVQVASDKPAPPAGPPPLKYNQLYA